MAVNKSRALVETSSTRTTTMVETGFRPFIIFMLVLKAKSILFVSIIDIVHIYSHSYHLLSLIKIIWLPMKHN